MVGLLVEGLKVGLVVGQVDGIRDGLMEGFILTLDGRSVGCPVG